MRILQLATGPSEMLDLHPNLTIVSGLADAGRDVLVDAVTRLARAEAADGPGLLEAHGVLFDLDPTLLGVIGITDGEVDPIVHPGQLPVQPTSVDARELRIREQAFAAVLDMIAELAARQSAARGAAEAASAVVDRAKRAREDAEAGGALRAEEIARCERECEELRDERRDAEEELRRAEAALAAAVELREQVERRTASVREARESAVALRASVEEELASLGPPGLPAAEVRVQRAAEALRSVEREVEEERAADAARAEEAARAAEASAQGNETDPEPAEVRLEQIDGRLHELERLLEVLHPVDRGSIEEAVGLVSDGRSSGLVASAEATQLAGRLDEVDRLLAGLEIDDEPDIADISLADARRRLDDAQQTLLEAERAARSPALDPDDVAHLEALHEELLDVMERAEGRFSKARAAATRVAELRAEEEEILERLGFASYSAYIMGDSLTTPDRGTQEAVELARRELSDAQDLWRVVDRQTEAALANAELRDRRRALLEQARSILGPELSGGRPQDALRAVRVPAVPLVEAQRVLRSALDLVGVDLGDEDLDPDDLVLIAEAWLAEADQVETRRNVALEERATLQDERAEVLVELEAQQASEDDVPSTLTEGGVDAETTRLERVAAARGALAVVESQLAEVEAVEERRARLQADLETAREIELVAIEAAASADAEMSEAEAEESRLKDRINALPGEIDAITQEIQEAQDALARLSAAEPDLATLDAEIEVAEGLRAEALANLNQVDRNLADVEMEGRAAALEIERLQDVVAAQGVGSASVAEELEWYLLARLAAQRSVSVAGSMPLLLDHALRGLSAEDVGHLLGRLERMAEAVQIIVLSEDPVVASWAATAGPARAAVVHPSPR